MKLRAILIAVLTVVLVSLSGTAYAQSASIPGDTNGDGKVDILDLSALLTDWGKSSTKADFNHDGIVDILDLSTILSNWTVDNQ